MNSTPRILMIDDSKMMHGLVLKQLASEAFDFHSAYSGTDGLAMTKSLRPDLILLDVEMTPPDGFTVCRELKNDSSVSNIPVIFLTSSSSTDQKIRGLNLGATDYITKPFEAAELQARIRAALRIKELIDLLSTKAMLDGLTGLWNRAYLDQRLREEQTLIGRRGGVFSCIMVDIDRFKSINDTYGHGFGDRVIKGIAQVLQKNSRPTDIVCRYGGEEFAILARDTKAVDASILANRIRTIVASAPFDREGTSIEVTCSMGVADSSEGADDILNGADHALYESKRNGRNRVTVFQNAQIEAA